MPDGIINIILFRVEPGERCVSPVGGGRWHPAAAGDDRHQQLPAHFSDRHHRPGSLSSSTPLRGAAVRAVAAQSRAFMENISLKSTADSEIHYY